MQSVVELQRKVEALADQIKDVLHATELNLSALGVQLGGRGESKPALSAHANCQRDLEELQQLVDLRCSLRLDFLITEQVKEEEGKVRRQRLVEYEEKIYDQRRLISDKEAFYQALLKPRRKRPPHLTPEEFQAQRKQEILIDERKNLRRLEQQTAELRAIEKTLLKDNAELEQALARLQLAQPSATHLQRLASIVAANPLVYDSVGSLGSRRDDREELRKVYEHVTNWQETGDQLRKQYCEERELQQYLRWEHEQLRRQYCELGEARILGEAEARKQFSSSNYRLRRSCSL